MQAQLLHLSGPLRGRTVTYPKPHLLIGSAADADVRLESAPAVAARHAVIEFQQVHCDFHLRKLAGQLFVNHREVEEIILQHGDLIEFGKDGPKARFRIWSEPGSVCKPVRQMLGDAQEVGRHSGVFASTGSLVRDLLTHATLQLKVGVPLVVLLLLLPLAYLAGWLGGGTHTKQRYEQDLAQVRNELEALRASRTSAISREEVENLRQQFARDEAKLERLAQAALAVKRVLAVYSRGVCLLHGVYGFAMAQDSGWAFLEGADGKRLEVEYLGSGFLADQQGHLVTNRHVAQPWWNDDEVAPILKLGYTPRFVSLAATFPGEATLPVDPATAVLRKDDVDVALLRVDLGERAIPVLPLFPGDPLQLRGEHVVVLGYPTGVNALLAKTEPDIFHEITTHTHELGAIIDELARRHAISPIATQGALNEVLDKRLVYDAETTSGGSGGPVFGEQGLVIGVNFGILRGFGGTNFGVPIRFARELLE